MTTVLIASGSEGNNQTMHMLLDKWNTTGLSKEELMQLENKTKKLLGEVKLHNMLFGNQKG